MGQSTDGIFCYGVDLGEDFDEVESRGFLDEIGDNDDADVYDEVTGRLLAAAGFTEPDPYPDREDRERTPDEHAAHMAWYRRRREAKDALLVELVSHCSSRCPTYILAARPVYTASRGDPKTVDLAALADPGAQAAREAALSSALKVLGLVPKSPPAWLLASYWS